MSRLTDNIICLSSILEVGFFLCICWLLALPSVFFITLKQWTEEKSEKSAMLGY